MNSKNDNQPVLTVAELAARWKCHRQSVMQKIHDEELCDVTDVWIAPVHGGRDYTFGHETCLKETIK